MTPAARLAAAIDLLDVILSAARDNGPPADRLVNDYFRARRYAGSKDRRAIQDQVFDTLRHAVSLSERLAAVGLAATGRTLALCALDDAETADAEGSGNAALFAGPHATHAPDAAEAAALAAARALPADRLSATARLECPAWLADHLDLDAAAPVLAALVGRAPLDLRVNTLKAEPEAVRAALAEQGVTAVPVAGTATALRVDPPVSLHQSPLMRDGAVEVQDANAQRACALAAAAPGETVIDLCAGAGGKTLALAAAMANEGRLWAVDIAPQRLKTLARRAAIAGVTVAETVALPATGKPRLRWLGAHAETADLVLADVPCSGTGTWRRSPELRLRLDAEWLDELRQRQARLLDEAAALVKPGGRLVYATCSILAGENDAQIAAFLDRRPDFALADPAGGPHAWTPDADGGDGFFAALLVRCPADA
ncbi:16S rRNA (cytosine967-C5)-methyltransferase [Rhodothalassium salexigens DSM 2132]|uniref:16S rRNA (Cytosine967-C5)-methyltransferase n=1 Tax=Rhodothalassium salexigens DSM 2132 TaxID=1188247 RepID=A0A4R2PTQ0_RHOSA|nr:RsmB/NOP family class I SAM-dependent RNA methyltransferase [Rhodothalassium salexigens]MBB4210360.1 16S rRNA (cytosine967-C5)-methyltransferase [Rhodothalassium salexigens DSM 2132]MBK1638901.1 hypothetical protein [Rhodothalassium salexigens DSM 2132]TCP38524.1 16S rRNA (cytosine967-C5)-methyltransferase [Rhodothalassium salexigens DSM 2132]